MSSGYFSDYLPGFRLTSLWSSLVGVFPAIVDDRRENALLLNHSDPSRAEDSALPVSFIFEQTGPVDMHKIAWNPDNLEDGAHEDGIAAYVSIFSLLIASIRQLLIVVNYRKLMIYIKPSFYISSRVFILQMDTTILVNIITRKADFRNLHRRFEELNYGMSSGLPPFAPNSKTKGLSTKRKPYCQNESRAIVLLCTQRERRVHFFYAIYR